VKSIYSTDGLTAPNATNKSRLTRVGHAAKRTTKGTNDMNISRTDASSESTESKHDATQKHRKEQRMLPALLEVIALFEAAYPGLGETARLVIAVAATTRLKRDVPLAVILIGGPSSGKTTCLMPLTRGKKDSALANGVFRIDDFTAASLVSHSSNQKPEALKKQDLLPQFKDKLVTVKEMAPFFSGNEDMLLDKFGKFTSVLDGEGYISGSGVHGRRGYAEKILFSFIGGVAKDLLTEKVWRLLGGIGPRFSFWEIPPREINPVLWEGPSSHSEEHQAAASTEMARFVDRLFETHAPGSVERHRFHFSPEFKTNLNRIAVALTQFRAIGVKEKGEDGETPPEAVYSTESPERVYRYLEQVVIGAALSAGRWEIEKSDLKLVLGLAVGSAPPSRRGVIKALLASTDKMTVRDVSIVIDRDDETARRKLDILTKVGFLRRAEFSGTREYDLVEHFKCLREIYGITMPAEEWSDELPF
jgi:hypothetical protein